MIETHEGTASGQRRLYARCATMSRWNRPTAGLPPVPPVSIGNDLSFQLPGSKSGSTVRTLVSVCRWSTEEAVLISEFPVRYPEHAEPNLEPDTWHPEPYPTV